MAATSPEVLLDQSASRAIGHGQVAALTGLRGFAALVVVVVHSSSLTAYPWVGFHTYGPIALFVLSGFLLFQPWSRWLMGVAERPSVSRFAWRRVWRIFPAYLALFFLAILIYPPSRPESASGWLRAITLTHIYAPADLTRGLYHTWSLGTELSWYFALPLVAISISLVIDRFGVPLMRTLTSVLAITLLVTILWRWAWAASNTPEPSLVPAYLLPSFAFCFAGGAFIGHLRVLQNEGVHAAPKGMEWVSQRPWLTLGAALFSGAIGASRLGGPWRFESATFTESTVRWIGMTSMAMLLVAGVAASSDDSIIRRLFACRPMAAVGRWSYGIYLWHMPLLLIMYREFGVQRGGLGLVSWIFLVAAVSIPFGAVTYRFVELPAIAWSKRSEPWRASGTQQPS